MRRQTCLFCVTVALLLVCSVRAHGQTVDRDQPFRTPDRRYELRSVVWKLRALKQVSSATPGWAAAPGEFFKLSLELLRYGKEDDFKRLLRDENPLARVMGLVCLAQLDFAKHSQTLRAHAFDQEVVTVAHECSVFKRTVGQIAGMLLKNPNFLGHHGTDAFRKEKIQN